MDWTQELVDQILSSVNHAQHSQLVSGTYDSNCSKSTENISGLLNESGDKEFSRLVHFKLMPFEVLFYSCSRPNYLDKYFYLLNCYPNKPLTYERLTASITRDIKYIYRLKLPIIFQQMIVINERERFFIMHALFQIFSQIISVIFEKPVDIQNHHHNHSISSSSAQQNDPKMHRIYCNGRVQSLFYETIDKLFSIFNKEIPLSSVIANISANSASMNSATLSHYAQSFYMTLSSLGSIEISEALNSFNQKNDQAISVAIERVYIFHPRQHYSNIHPSSNNINTNYLINSLVYDCKDINTKLHVVFPWLNKYLASQFAKMYPLLDNNIIGYVTKEVLDFHKKNKSTNDIRPVLKYLQNTFLGAHLPTVTEHSSNINNTGSDVINKFAVNRQLMMSNLYHYIGNLNCGVPSRYSEILLNSDLGGNTSTSNTCNLVSGTHLLHRQAFHQLYQRFLVTETKDLYNKIEFTAAHSADDKSHQATKASGNISKRKRNINSKAINDDANDDENSSISEHSIEASSTNKKRQKRSSQATSKSSVTSESNSPSNTLIDCYLPYIDRLSAVDSHSLFGGGRESLVCDYSTQQLLKCAFLLAESNKLDRERVDSNINHILNHTHSTSLDRAYSLTSYEHQYEQVNKLLPILDTQAVKNESYNKEELQSLSVEHFLLRKWFPFLFPTNTSTIAMNVPIQNPQDLGLIHLYYTNKEENKTNKRKLNNKKLRAIHYPKQHPLAVLHNNKVSRTHKTNISFIERNMWMNVADSKSQRLEVITNLIAADTANASNQPTSGMTNIIFDTYNDTTPATDILAMDLYHAHKNAAAPYNHKGNTSAWESDYDQLLNNNTTSSYYHKSNSSSSSNYRNNRKRTRVLAQINDNDNIFDDDSDDHSVMTFSTSDTNQSKQPRTTTHTLNENDNNGEKAPNHGTEEVQRIQRLQQHLLSDTNTNTDSDTHDKSSNRVHDVESFDAAFMDAEMPSIELVNYLKDLASLKVSTLAHHNKVDKTTSNKSTNAYEQVDDENHSVMSTSTSNTTSSAKTKTKAQTNNFEGAANEQIGKLFQQKFDTSSILAIAILVEELARDLMLQYKARQAPLELNYSNLKAAVYSLLNGAKDVLRISEELLINRLESMFACSLAEFVPVICDLRNDFLGSSCSHPEHVNIPNIEQSNYLPPLYYQNQYQENNPVSSSSSTQQQDTMDDDECLQITQNNIILVEAETPPTTSFDGVSDIDNTVLQTVNHDMNYLLKQRTRHDFSSYYKDVTKLSQTQQKQLFTTAPKHIRDVVRNRIKKVNNEDQDTIAED